MAQEMTLDQALAKVMPFGKFRGLSFAEIIAEDDGRRYLEWISEQPWWADKGDLVEAVSLVLEVNDEDAE